MDLSTLMPQQLQIVKTLDRPLFVSAGAGSGKTFTLTRRIVYALSPESGPFVEHLDQVLAITFTKDAAAEIRDRVRRALIDEGMDEEALTVDDAWISTIHGMCSRILRAHALELGIDPEFTVLTDTDELMDQAVEHVLARATAPDAAPELAASLKALYAWYPMAGEGGPFGAGTTIKGLVRELLELSSQLPGGMDYVRVARGQADTSALADAYRAALGASKAATEKAQVALDAIDAFEASGKTAQQMKEMIDAMDDETFIRFFRPYMRAILSMQMQQETAKAYSGMTSQEIISAINAKGISRSQYADVYDNYVASAASGSTYNSNLKKLGYVDKDSPSAINIYASSFENKDQISACIDDYNAGAAEDDQISYTDYVGLLMSSITTIINAISYVLIGFVAISLVVSSIMIGIITYISVLERTKEIGILRSIGASKQDISRVFNAETLIEGFTAGVIGILCTLILLIPINLIVHHLTGLPTLSAILPVLGAILLILISMALTFIAGLIPSGMAAKKDPVVALRTE